MSDDKESADPPLSLGAFDDLIPLHSPVVHAYFVRRAESAADDLHAETWLAAFESRTTYDPALGPVRPWLIGIARNVLLSHYRRAKRETPAPISDLVDPDSNWGDVDARLDAMAVRPALRAGLGQLSPQERELLLLVAWDQLEPTEAALVLGIPPGTARTRLFRARRRLRERMACSDQQSAERRTSQ